jgi:hypothetical protein
MSLSHIGIKERQAISAGLPSSTTTSPFREPPCCVKPVGEEPMPHLDATGNFATWRKIVKGDGRKFIFASEIAGVKNGLEE